MLGLSAGAAEAVGNAKNGSRAGSEGYVLEVRGGGPRALLLGRGETYCTWGCSGSAAAPSCLMPQQVRFGTASLHQCARAPLRRSARTPSMLPSPSCAPSQGTKKQGVSPKRKRAVLDKLRKNAGLQ